MEYTDMDYNTALEIVSALWGIDKVIVENTLSNIKRRMKLSPCAICEQGWGSITTTGYKSCADDCLTLEYWRKHNG